MTTSASDSSVSPSANPSDPFRLRPDPPRVVRLSRKVLGGLAIITTVGIGGALIFALQDRPVRDRPGELFTTENRPTADELRRLPSDYSGVPRLGPALPGDLGRPILRTQDAGQPVPASPMPGPDPAEQRRLAEEEAARTSEVFFATQSPTAPSGFAAPSAAPPGSFTAPQPDGIAQTDQDRQLAFLNAPVDRRIVAPDRVTPPASPYVLQAGSVIPAALVTGIRSDLPGLITAQVTQNVYDSPSGRFLLLPQGSRLIGEYDNGVGFGQRRILLVWNRIILPDGRSIVLERLPGTDSAGYAGLEDGVNHHWGDLLRAAGLATLLNIGTELTADEDDPVARAIRDGVQDTIGNAGQGIVSRQLDVPPTLTIRPGFPVRVIVTRDLILEPRGGH